MSLGTVIGIGQTFAHALRLTNWIFSDSPHYGEPTIYHLNRFDLPDIDGENFESLTDWYDAFKAKLEKSSLPSKMNVDRKDPLSYQFVAMATNRMSRLFLYHVTLDEQNADMSISFSNPFGSTKVREILDQLTVTKSPIVPLDPFNQKL